jgi:hypothetical protein
MVDETEMMRRLEFHEKRKNDASIPRYWREKSEVNYWHYLELLTKPNEV